VRDRSGPEVSDLLRLSTRSPAYCMSTLLKLTPMVGRLQERSRNAVPSGSAQQCSALLQPCSADDSQNASGSDSESMSPTESCSIEQGTSAGQLRSTLQQQASSRTRLRLNGRIDRSSDPTVVWTPSTALDSTGAAGTAASASVLVDRPCPAAIRHFRGRGVFCSETSLCTAFCQGLQRGTKLQLLVSVHDADWDPDQYMADLTAAEADAQDELDDPDNLLRISSSARALHFCQADLKLRRHRDSCSYYISLIQQDNRLEAFLQVGHSRPYEVALQEKVRRQQSCLR